MSPGHSVVYVTNKRALNTLQGALSHRSHRHMRRQILHSPQGRGVFIGRSAAPTDDEGDESCRDEEEEGASFILSDHDDVLCI